MEKILESFGDLNSRGQLLEGNGKRYPMDSDIFKLNQLVNWSDSN